MNSIACDPNAEQSANGKHGRGHRGPLVTDLPGLIVAELDLGLVGGLNGERRQILPGSGLVNSAAIAKVSLLRMTGARPGSNLSLRDQPHPLQPFARKRDFGSSSSPTQPS